MGDSQMTFVVNVQEVARVDRTGLLALLFAWWHPLCSNSEWCILCHI